ncbi:hypothetical protein Cfor_08918 [Coptotermes formosanus]|uniref:Uncharacterized protein n=1 Tax=Coptotermes formosanus TaxID=36987 RepID=A0A6L2Q682_COPFO|nr:hypothetical protein Cfor_08918 [Coptotermes formosanus]
MGINIQNTSVNDQEIQEPPIMTMQNGRLRSHAALNRQAARMGEQSSVPQTWTTLATCKAAV